MTEAPFPESMLEYLDKYLPRLDDEVYADDWRRERRRSKWKPAVKSK